MPATKKAAPVKKAAAKKAPARKAAAPPPPPPVEVDGAPRKVTDSALTKTAEAMGLTELADVEPAALKEEARSKPEASVETVTPAIALRWLGANVKNRDLRMPRVISFAGSLARKEYKLTADGVGFDVDGFLVNGQHRLSGIVVAEVPALLVVVRGLPPESQTVMDQGLRRSVGDALKLRGEANVHVLAAALNWYYRFSYIERTGVVHYANPVDKPTTPQLLQVLDKNEAIRDTIKSGARMRRAVPFRSGLLAAAWHKLRQIDPQDAEAFFEQIYEGVNLQRTDPAYQLRTVIINDSYRGNDKMPDWREAAMIFKAWNAWREGRPVEHLAFRYSATNKETWPTPV